MGRRFGGKDVARSMQAELEAELEQAGGATAPPDVGDRSWIKPHERSLWLKFEIGKNAIFFRLKHLKW